MYFWWYMFLMNLMIPCMMIGFGKYFMKKAPQEINYVFGYRTRMSMINQDTWRFAHEHCGRLWSKCGVALLVVSVGMMFFIFGEDQNRISSVGGIICFLQLLVLLGSLVPTEWALKKNFDSNCQRR